MYYTKEHIKSAQIIIKDMVKKIGYKKTLEAIKKNSKKYKNLYLFVLDKYFKRSKYIR